MSHERATRIYTMLLLELQLEGLFKHTGSAFAEDRTDETTIDLLLSKAEEAYEQAGRPPIYAREECLKLIEQNYSTQ